MVKNKTILVLSFFCSLALLIYIISYNMSDWKSNELDPVALRNEIGGLDFYLSTKKCELDIV